MKKFYLGAIVTAFLSTLSISVEAQPYTGGVFTTVQNGSLSNVATWDVNGIPGNPCNDCQIVINFNNSFDFNHWTLTNGSQVLVSAGATLSINGWIEVYNSTVVAATPSTIYLNDEVDLYNSNVQLANTGVVLDATNAGANLSHGPINNGSAQGGGLYYIEFNGNPITGSTFFDVVLMGSGANGPGYGGSFSPVLNPLGANHWLNPYNLCAGACPDGVVSGPVGVQYTNLPAPYAATSTYHFVQITPLPVILTQFDAVLNPDKTVSVNWSTAQEVNSDYFSIERSVDGEKWASIGRVKAKGNSSIPSTYTLTDHNPLTAINYYRLQMVDLDGKFKYSKVATVTLDGKPGTLIVYNNPFHDQIRLKLTLGSNQNLDLRVTDVVGRTFYHGQVNGQAGDNLININPSGMTSGVYVLSINGQTYVNNIKLVKQ